MYAFIVGEEMTERYRRVLKEFESVGGSLVLDSVHSRIFGWVKYDREKGILVDAGSGKETEVLRMGRLCSE